MSSSSNGELPDQELERLRQLNRQYQKQVSETAQLNTELQLKVDELEPEQNRLLMLQSPLSPNIIQNLQDSLHDMQMEQLFITLSPASQKRLLRWETKFIQRLERRFPKSKRQQQQPNQELEGLRELNRQYQQQVSQTAQLNWELQQKVDELELEKIRSPLLSPLSPIIAQNLQPAMMSVATLDENKVQVLTPAANAQFNLYPHLAVMTTAGKQETPRLTVESSLHTYLAGFYAYVSPSDNIAFQTTHQDIYKTLIQALYDG